MVICQAMRSLCTLGLLFSTGYGLPSSTLGERQSGPDSWISKEASVAYAGILANIGPNGAKAYGASAGIMLASPSKTNPNYFYTWTRDSGLTMKALIDRFIRSPDSNLQILINDYVSAQAEIQAIQNPSGGLSNGTGLGEPKFNPNLTEFTSSWGRPQRDGPALRATALIAYGNWLNEHGYKDAASGVVWPIVRNDLEYVAQYWNQTGFDLWEEVEGSSFFATAVQHRALVEGSAFASTVGSSCPSCDSQAPLILCLLQTFWNGQYIVSNTNVKSINYVRTGKDTDSILGSVHTFDPNAGCNEATFQPCSEKMLANHKHVVDSMRFYGVNNGIPSNEAVAIGRYAEDVYYEGNPWYLTTLAAAEQLYFALHTYSTVGAISITNVSLPFWQQIVPSTSAGVFSSGSPEFSTLTNTMRNYADGFVSIVERYAPADGSLAEQFHKNNGTPTSAHDLTWSYASVLTMQSARNGDVPRPWGASNANTVPSQCLGPSITGSYSASNNRNWPSFSCSNASSVLFTFNLKTTTGFGQEISVSGNIAELGNWDVNRTVLLNAQDYTNDVPLWRGSVTLAAGTSFEYKFVQSMADGTSWTWEGGANRQYTVPTSCRTEASVGDTSWQP